MKRFLTIAAIAVGSIALVGVGGTYGAAWYYTSQHGQGCASCHEMAVYVSAIHGSPHRNETCMDCHTASLGTKLRHIRVHLAHSWPESIRLRDSDVLEMAANCRKCHQREFAAWAAGPHSATYAQIFTDSAHNTKRALQNDCFRCHGMYFQGSIRDIVAPLDAKGPWHLIRADLANQPTMPCQTCHWMHREGQPESKPLARISVTGAPIRNSLAFYDRRERLHFAAVALPIPQLHDGARAVTISQDPRQAICYQCHAPRIAEAGTTAALNAWGPQIGSGDDRTPMGVHEGISCVSCHNGHNQNARASCKTCHPQMSHCGIDVEKMDTTFANAASQHNIHWVKCADCHVNGIPKPQTPTAVHKKVVTTPGMNG